MLSVWRWGLEELIQENVRQFFGVGKKGGVVAIDFD
jgi:hypothetical protein